MPAHTTESLAYGATVTTARDRTLVTRGLLYGGGPLQAAGRATAWGYMSNVTPTQRWGVTRACRRAGRSRLKNGFYPMQGNGWRVGSTGFVRQTGTNSGYVITVLTDRNPSQVAGMSLVEAVSLRVARALAGRTRTRGGQPLPVRHGARRLVLAVRRAQGARGRRALGRGEAGQSGGNPSPLSGQRVCSPDLGPVPR